MKIKHYIMCGLGAVLIAVLATQVYAVPDTMEFFAATCENRSCGLAFTNVPALDLKTNSVEPMMPQSGYTNIHVTATLVCPFCVTTNKYESEFLVHAPRALHVEKPPIVPHRMAQPPLVTNIVAKEGQKIIVPEGYEILIIKKL